MKKRYCMEVEGNFCSIVISQFVDGRVHICHIELVKAGIVPL